MDGCLKKSPPTRSAVEKKCIYKCGRLGLLPVLNKRDIVAMLWNDTRSELASAITFPALELGVVLSYI